VVVYGREATRGVAVGAEIENAGGSACFVGADVQDAYLRAPVLAPNMGGRRRDRQCRQQGRHCRLKGNDSVPG
jgi:hypothetical protein